jgi:hypothetical protein
MMKYVVSFLIVGMVGSWSSTFANPSVDDLPDLTGGVVPIVKYKTLDPFTGTETDILTSVAEVAYEVRIKNLTGDPLIADSLILVVDNILEITGKEISHRLGIPGSDGKTREGKPFFRVPHTEKDFPPYGESEPVTIRVINPDFLRFFPPGVRVLGIRRSSDKAVKDLLEALVKKGVLSPEEAAMTLESSSSSEEDNSDSPSLSR